MPPAPNLASLPGLDPSRPNVLCLNSLQLNRDVTELIAHGRRFAYPTFPDTLLIDAQKDWMPAEMQVQSLYVNFEGPEVDQIWVMAKQLAIQIIEDIRASGINVVAVLAANWDYWHEEAFRRACLKLGLPFLVLLREHFLTAHGYQENEEYFAMVRRIPEVTAVAMAGPATLDIFTRLNLFPHTPLRLTGWPRLDAWRRPAQPAYDRPIVLMAYYKGYGADRHFIDVVVPLFAGLAARYPHVPFLLKAKHWGEQQILSKVAGPHVQVIDTLDLPSVLCNARMVIGDNSMIMFEALLSPARILIPFWGEANREPKTMAPSPGDGRLGEHVTFVQSAGDFCRRIHEAATGDTPAPDMAARIALFGQYFSFDPQYSCVARVEDFIAEFTGATNP